jgi:hypothetical protein
MIPPEQIAEIRRLYYAEHWKIGTIAGRVPEAVDFGGGASRRTG